MTRADAPSAAFVRSFEYWAFVFERAVSLRYLAGKLEKLIRSPFEAIQVRGRRQSAHDIGGLGRGRTPENQCELPDGRTSLTGKLTGVQLPLSSLDLSRNFVIDCVTGPGRKRG